MRSTYAAVIVYSFLSLVHPRFMEAVPGGHDKRETARPLQKVGELTEMRARGSRPFLLSVLVGSRDWSFVQ